MEIDCPECKGKKVMFYEWSNGIAVPCETCQVKRYTKAELQQAVKEEREACLKILIEEQKEFAEDRDKQALVYSIAALRARVNE